MNLPEEKDYPRGRKQPKGRKQPNVDESLPSPMTFNLQHLPKVLQTYLELQQYPILSRVIRERMREEIFDRGVILPDVLDQEVKAKAIESQEREGIANPLFQETEAQWTERTDIIRDQLTDFYFSHNLPHDLLTSIVQEVINHRRPGHEVVLSFNPELAPWDLLFAQAERWKTLPPDEYATIKHHIQEFIVVLTKALVSDQLAFIGIAREYFSMDDLHEIRRRRIGRGKIGGKAAGLLLAWKILQQEAHNIPDFDLCDRVNIPESFYIGADVFYDFVSLNNLHRFMNQKYRNREQIEKDFPGIQAAYNKGRFPAAIVQGLENILKEAGKTPLIVRSSSLLEDNFGFSFSGKYESVFCPNQATLEENLKALQDAIRTVYASVLNPDALFYRRHRGLLDYDERMAILIQKVEGKARNGKLFPTLAGVAFSRNPHRWNPRIQPEAGFVRLVVGLGTRAVDRVANDFPRMIALSHPTLRPETSPRQIKQYSQQYADLIDLTDNQLKTVPVEEVLSCDGLALQFLASKAERDYIRPLVTNRSFDSPDELVLTFDQLLQRTKFVDLLRHMLNTLENHYQQPVDIEFAGEVNYRYPEVDINLTLLQCRPLSSQEEVEQQQIPTNIPSKDIVFSANYLVPNGVVKQIEYIVYVPPEVYSQVPDDNTRLEIARVVGRLNQKLEGANFILMGPGRWGSSNLELGVKVSYSEIFNCRALIEIAMPRDGGRPEVSHGTHFFQDLVEANIYPLALYPGESGVIFDQKFLNRAPNQLSRLLPKDARFSDLVRVIHLPSAKNGRMMDLIMNSDEDKALAFLRD